MSTTDPYIPPVKKRGPTSASVKTGTSDAAVYSRRVTKPPKKTGTMCTERKWDPLNPAQSEKENC